MMGQMVQQRPNGRLHATDERYAGGAGAMAKRGGAG